MLFWLVLVFALLLHEFFRRRSTARKPPGPTGYPIIGNLLDIPRGGNEWKMYAEWSLQYGDMMSLTIPGTTLIVVNSYTRALSLFESKSKGAVYSDRPLSAMAGELVGLNRNPALLPYGEKWKQSRRWMSREFGSALHIRKSFEEHLEEQAKDFAELVVRDDTKLYDHVYRHAGAIIMRIAYGYRLEDTDDPVLRAANKVMEAMSECMNPTSFLCNQIPILRHIPEWVPGADFRRLARLWRAELDSSTVVPLEWARTQIARGTAEESFVSKTLEAGVSDEDEELFRLTAGAMFLAGSDTTAITTYSLFVLLARNPAIQKRAQAEIDSVVGRGRKPNLEDADPAKMPFLDALIKEVLRIHVPITLGVPHATTADDITEEGWFVPKGSTIITNLRAMLYDPELYADPETFNPDRFLGPSPELDPGHIVFGFGRRICPGNTLALASLRITAAIILSQFNIRGAVGKDGREEIPGFKPSAGAICHLEEVKVRVVPRL